MQADVALDKQAWTQINFPDASFRWVITKTYSWSGSASDTSLIAALLAHPSFRDHYCAPGETSEVDDAVHGPYRLEAVTVGAFRAATPEMAIEQFDDWLHRSDSEGVRAGEDPDIEEAVQPVRALLTSGDARYHLPDLGDGAQHGWGWVLWHFREWIIIDHGQRRLHTIAVGLD